MKRYLAEFIGAFFLVFVGAGAIIADVYRSKTLVTDSFGLLGIALAHGLALAVAIAAIARISGGHANPAVTLAFWVARRMKAADMAGYIVAQLLGGVAAAFLLKGLMPADAFSNAGAGVPALADGIQPLKAIAIEGILTFFLTFVIWGVAVDRKGPKALAPFAIGLTVTFGILAGGTFTGAALNPARWFGPALASGQWATPLVYIAGPILGALLASLVYEVFFLDEESEPEDIGVIDDNLEESARDWGDTPSPLVPPAGDRLPAEGPDSPLRPPAPEVVSTSWESVKAENPMDSEEPAPPAPTSYGVQPGASSSSAAASSGTGDPSQGSSTPPPSQAGAGSSTGGSYTPPSPQTSPPGTPTPPAPSSEGIEVPPMAPVDPNATTPPEEPIARPRADDENEGRTGP